MKGVVVTDTYTRTLAAGWGNANTGQAWSTFAAGGTIAAADWSTNGAAGLHSVPVVNGYRASYLGGYSSAYGDIAITGSVSAVPTGGPLEVANLMARGTDINHYVLFRVQVETSGALTAYIFGYDGAQTGPVTVPGITYTAGMQIRVRAQFASKTLRLKVWPVAGTEPVAWLLSTTDSSYTGAGWVGVRSGVSGSNTNTLPMVFTYDDFASVQVPDFPRDPLPFTVLAAFGADLSADPSTWPWTNITADVRFVTAAPRVVQGRADDTSQTSPATAALELNNTGPNYPYSANNPLSVNWPNVKRNTPVWVIIDPHTRFFGYADGFVPSWDTAAKVPIVKLSASGVLRRLQQGKTPVQSPMRHAITAAKPVAYYPMEDAASSTSIASGLAGGAPLTPLGAVTYANESSLPGSLPALTLTASTNVLTYFSGTFHGQWQVDWYTKIPAWPSAETVLMRVFTDGAVRWWDFSIGTDGGGQYHAVHGFSPASASVVDSGHFAPNSWMIGQWIHLRLMAQQSGGNINWRLVEFPLTGVGSFLSGTLAGTVGNATGFSLPSAPGLAGVSMSHLAVLDAYNFSATDQAALAYPGETATARMSRICTEVGIPLVVVGTSTTAMGPQPIDIPLNVLRECETADLGLLLDGHGPGLTYIARSARYNQNPAVTVDMAQGQVAPSFQPADDDQRNRNQWKVDRRGGSNATYADATGPLGTDPLKGIGIYESQVTLNVNADTALPGQASWRTHLGTTPGFRYPTLNLDLGAVPSLMDSWPGTRMLSRVDVLNVDTATGHAPGTVGVLNEGYTETYTPFCYDVSANCSPESPWRVFVLGTSRLSSPSSTVRTGVAQGASTVQVNVGSGQLWATAPAVYPMTAEIDGIKVTVTAVAGAASPQTFTLDPATVVKPLVAGRPVRVWRPDVLAL